MSDLELPPAPAPAALEPSGINVWFYVFGGLSFIPLCGFPVGLVIIVLGFLKRSKVLILLGVGGMATTVLLYGSLFYFGFYQRGGVYDSLRNKMLDSSLVQCVKEIEFYKIQNGKYPAKLEDLDNKMYIIDPTSIQRAGSSGFLYYELEPKGEFYFLRSVGPDGMPFTKDDVLPALPAGSSGKTGLRLEK